jgi:hypothetical protein
MKKGMLTLVKTSNGAYWGTVSQETGYNVFLPDMREAQRLIEPKHLLEAGRGPESLWNAYVQTKADAILEEMELVAAIVALKGKFVHENPLDPSMILNDDRIILELVEIEQVSIQLVVMLSNAGQHLIRKYEPNPKESVSTAPEELDTTEIEEQGHGIHRVRPHKLVVSDKMDIKNKLQVPMPDGTVKEMDWSVLLESAVYHPQGAQSDTVWDRDLMARCVHSLTHPASQQAGATDVNLQHVQNVLLFVFRKILRECGATRIDRNHLLDYDGRYWGYVMGNAKRVWYAVVDMFWAAILHLQNTLRACEGLYVKFSKPEGYRICNWTTIITSAS